MQATVMDFETRSDRCGRVVTDDGVILSLAPDALEGSGLRHLRTGQRVTCSRLDERTVTRVRVVGIGT